MTIPERVVVNSKAGSARKWKSIKRKQARKARKAIDDLRSGCAYFPSGSDDVEAAASAIERIIDDISVKHFGR